MTKSTMYQETKNVKSHSDTYVILILELDFEKSSPKLCLTEMRHVHCAPLSSETDSKFFLEPVSFITACP